MEQDSTCPYCNERPMGKRKNAATCGDKVCQRKRELERLHTDEWRERMRNNMRAKRAAGMETETMEDRTCEACGCTYRVKARLPQRYCSQKCNAATQDMMDKSIRARKAFREASRMTRTRTCKTCGHDFQTTGWPLFCSPLCSYLDRYNPSCEVVRSTCRTCGRTILWHSVRTYCSTTCKRNRPQRWRKHALAVHERDQWTCQLCGTPTLREWVKGDMRSPTLDHIMPRSLGGSDDIANLRTAHWLCNSIRGNEAETHAVTPTW